MRLRIDTPNIWFTADLHLGHKNILKYSGRPFANIKEHDTALINNINGCVINPDKDWLFILGDFCLSKSSKIIQEYSEAIKCKNIVLVLGGHDQCSMHTYLKCFTRVYRYLELKATKYPDEDMVLFHNPIERWERCHYGSIHLHGHVHNNDCNLYVTQGGGIRFNVGVDSAAIWLKEYRPFHINELISKFDAIYL